MGVTLSPKLLVQLLISEYDLMKLPVCHVCVY